MLSFDQFVALAAVIQPPLQSIIEKGGYSEGAPDHRTQLNDKLGLDFLVSVHLKRQPSELILEVDHRKGVILELIGFVDILVGLDCLAVAIERGHDVKVVVVVRRFAFFEGFAAVAEGFNQGLRMGLDDCFVLC